jgi:hypothetical protein
MDDSTTVADPPVRPEEAVSSSQALEVQAPKAVVRAENPSQYSPQMREDAQKAKIAYESGAFGHIKNIAQAIVILWAGRSLGLDEYTAWSGIYIVRGKTVLSAGILASLVKRHPHYSYRVVSLTDDGCQIDFYDRETKLGTSSFTAADAKRAGLLGGDNYRNYPRNLFFARAISNGARWYCPDVVGSPFIEPDEDVGVTDLS